MTTGFEFEWLKILEEAERGEVNNEPDSDPGEEVHTMSEAAAAFNDPDRYEEGMYPLPYTDWHPSEQHSEPDQQPTEVRDAYDGYDDPPSPPGDLENFVNDVGEFISDPIGSVFRSLFG